MTYESWRISYQSSEQAARAAFAKVEELAAKLAELEGQEPVAWARFCGAFGDGPDAPYPGMIAAFEIHYGQSFRDKEWRTEAACWAAAWSKATARAEASTTEPQPGANSAPIEAIRRILTEVMDEAARNGAGSRSMPDGYVEVAAIARAESALSEPQPDADSWIPWAGGKCPVDANVEVVIKDRSGRVWHFGVAGNYDWNHDEYPLDILFYRIVEARP